MSPFAAASGTVGKFFDILDRDWTTRCSEIIPMKVISRSDEIPPLTKDDPPRTSWTLLDGENGMVWPRGAPFQDLAVLAIDTTKTSFRFSNYFFPSADDIKPGDLVTFCGYPQMPHHPRMLKDLLEKLQLEGLLPEHLLPSSQVSEEEREEAVQMWLTNQLKEAFHRFQGKIFSLGEVKRVRCNVPTY